MTAAQATLVHLPTASATTRRPPPHAPRFVAGTPQALLGAGIGLPVPPPVDLPHDGVGLIVNASLGFAWTPSSGYSRKPVGRTAEKKGAADGSSGEESLLAKDNFLFCSPGKLMRCGLLEMILGD